MVKPTVLSLTVINTVIPVYKSLESSGIRQHSKMRIDFTLLVITGCVYVSVSESTSPLQNNITTTQAIGGKFLLGQCDEKSEVWNATAAQKLSTICDGLTYDFQTDFCFIEDDKKLECLRERASMHDINSCNCLRPNLMKQECVFVEVCMFSDPSFVCDDSYSCHVNDTNHEVRCLSETGQPPVQTICHTSFIHSLQESNKLCSIMNLSTHFRNIFKELCLTENRTSMMNNSTWYYLDRVHFNKSNFEFASLAPILIAENDKDNKCIKEDVCDLNNAIGETPTWKIVIPTLAGIVIIIALIFAFKKYRTRYLEEEVEWKELMKKAIKPSVFDSSPAAEPHETPPEELSTEICQPPELLNETNMKPKISAEETNIPGQVGSDNDGYEKLLQASAGQNTYSNTTNSFNNDSYQMRRSLDSESIPEVSLGEYSRPFAEVPESESIPLPNCGEYSSR